MITLNSFYETLRERAHWTNEIMNKGVFLRLGIMEETITDMHLLTIAEKHSDYVLTRKFTRREEGSKSGADWLWVIGEPGSWIPLLIQAKIINPKTGNCQYLDYKDGEQRTKLLYYARQHKLVPVYCIYSSIPQSFSPPHVLDYEGREKEDWACSFVSPKRIRLLSEKGQKNQKDILKYGIPWMDIFNIPARDTSTGQAIGEKIVNICNNIDNDERKKLTATKDINSSLSKHANWENLDTHKAIVKVIPKFICKMLKDSHNPSDSPFNEVSIISTVPINQVSELKTD
jgi:hypothetical protein